MVIGPLIVGAVVGFGIAAGCGFVLGRKYERERWRAAGSGLGAVETDETPDTGEAFDAEEQTVLVAPPDHAAQFAQVATGQGVVAVLLLDQVARWRQTHGQRAVESLTEQIAAIAGRLGAVWQRPDDSVAAFLPRDAGNPERSSATQIRAVVAAVREATFTVRGEPVHATASFGWCVQPGEPRGIEPVERLLRQAELAAGEASRYGRNQSCQWTEAGIRRDGTT